MLATDMDSSYFWTAIITAVGLVLVKLWSMYLDYRRGRDAAEAVEMVKETAATAVNSAEDARIETRAARVESQQELATIHALVNSNMGAALKLTAELSRWKADQTGEEIHRQQAEQAEKMYHEHMARQDRVDARDARDSNR